MNMSSTNNMESIKLKFAMLAVVEVASVLSGIAPASRAVWFTEMFWAWGLVAILLLIFRRNPRSVANDWVNGNGKEKECGL